MKYDAHRHYPKSQTCDDRRSQIVKFSLVILYTLSKNNSKLKKIHDNKNDEYTFLKNILKIVRIYIRLMYVYMDTLSKIRIGYPSADDWVLLQTSY